MTEQYAVGSACQITPHHALTSSRHHVTRHPSPVTRHPSPVTRHPRDHWYRIGDHPRLLFKQVEDNNPERLVVVTSTPDGVAPLTPGELSTIEHEPHQVEQIAVVGHSFPKLMPGDPARTAFDQCRAAFADSDATQTVFYAQEAISRRPTYLPAHIFAELGANIARRRNLQECANKCLATIDLGQGMLKGHVEKPPTEQPIEPEHINELLDIARYNLSDRYMRLGRYSDALEQLSLSEMLPKSIEARMKRRMKEASLLYRLKDRETSRIKLKQARDMDRELFALLRERMSADGHLGVDQPL